jgi:glycerol-3-phosphate dehydrogenase
MGQAPLLSVFGGKITTFRKLAESVLEKIVPFFPKAGKPWTAATALPGGDFPFDEVETRVAELQRKYSFFLAAKCAAHIPRLWHQCGENV